MSAATDVIAVTLSGGSLLVAGWAGWTAHRAREWQQERDEEQRATRVGIHFEHHSGPSGPDGELVYTVTLLAINHGESTEYVTEASLDAARETEGPFAGGRLSLSMFGGSAPPGTITHHGIRADMGGVAGRERYELRPRDVLAAKRDLDKDVITEFRDGFVGVVSLGSGAVVMSDVEQLNDDIVDELER